MNLSYFNIPYFMGFVKRFLFITMFSVGWYGNVHVPSLPWWGRGDEESGAFFRRCHRHLRRIWVVLLLLFSLRTLLWRIMFYLIAWFSMPCCRHDDSSVFRQNCRGNFTEIHLPSPGKAWMRDLPSTCLFTIILFESAQKQHKIKNFEKSQKRYWQSRDRVI